MKAISTLNIQYNYYWVAAELLNISVQAVNICMDVTSSLILTTVTSYLQGINYSNLRSIVRTYNIAIHRNTETPHECCMHGTSYTVYYK